MCKSAGVICWGADVCVCVFECMCVCRFVFVGVCGGDELFR